MSLRQRLITGFAVALVLLGTTIGPAAADDASAADAAGYVTDFAQFLGFVGGIPLSPAQRQRVADQTAADIRAHPESVRGTDETIRKMLANLEAGDESAIGERREELRLQFALVPATNVGRVVVDHNDPTVVFDAERKRLITERSLAALERGCAWMAHVLGVAGPDASFIATQRELFRDHYDRLTDDQQETLAHVERDVPLLVNAYKNADAAKQAQFARAVLPYARDHARLAPLTLAIASATYSAVQTKGVNDSIVLMGAMNTTMLLHAGYYH